ncbi:hypothetical protein [Sorangium sp. So ce854]|uniref:hypothetical protein n=1 Tax=Sorangium sp. So ce854 TaxID=3133322 RepID=UPI003F5EEC7B
MQESFAIGFVRWWCHQAEGNYAARLADDLAYDAGFDVLEREEFLLMRAGSGAMEDIRIVDARGHADGDAVMFEATDTITGLRHRTCWMISYRGDQVVRVSACWGAVPKPGDNPSVK